MALSDVLKSFSRELLKEQGVKTSLEKVEADGCDRETLVTHLWLVARPGKHKKDWYALPRFRPDKLRRYPFQLRDQADQIEALNRTIRTDGLYGGVVTHIPLVLNAKDSLKNKFTVAA